MIALLLPATAFLTALLLPHAAAIQFINPMDVVNSIGSQLPGIGKYNTVIDGISITGPEAVAVSIVFAIRPLVMVAAFGMLLYTGYFLIAGQDDSAKEKAKGMLLSVIAGVLLAYLSGPILLSFYGTAGESIVGNPAIGLQRLCTLTEGLVNWSLGIVGILAMLMMIVTGLQAVTSLGNEEYITRLRKALIAIIAALLLISLRVVITKTLLGNNAGCISGVFPSLFGAINMVVNYLLGILAFVAVVIVIYAGILYLTSFGSEGQAEKGKGLLTRAALGIAVIFVSYAMIRLVLGFLGA